MARMDHEQLNVRSRFARERVASLARQTGMTATQIVEEALRAYAPPPATPPGRLERRGRLLVLVGGNPVSHEEAEAAIDAVRTERE